MRCILFSGLLTTSIAFAAAPPVRSPEMADFLRADSFAAIGMRDWKGFAKRSDTLARSLGNDRVGKRLAEVSAAADQLKFSITNDFSWLEMLNGDRMVLGQSLTPKERKARKTQKAPAYVKDPDISNPTVHLPDRTLVSNQKENLEQILKSPTLSPVLSPSYRQAMNEADLLAHLNLEAIRKSDPNFFRLPKAADFHPEGAVEQAVAQQIEAIQHDTRWLLLTARVDKGVGLRLRAEFTDKLTPPSAKLLQSFDSAGRRSHLKGLPPGRVVLAQATALDGSTNAHALKLATRGFLRGRFLEGGAMATVSQAADHPLLSSAFASLWSRFTSRRLALYHNTDEAKHGLFSLVTILDTPDPEKTLDALARLARFTRGDELDLTAKGRDLADVRQLVAELDHEEYATREAASANLLLIGPPALPLVRTAAETGTPEQRRRARRLVGILEELRKQALKPELVRNVQPRFELKRDAEKIEGVAVHHLHVRLLKTDAAYVPMLKQLIGPGWDTIRVAVIDKQIVVVVGSDPNMFLRTVQNLKTGHPGLQAAPLLANFRRHADPNRLLEAHVALEAAAALDPTKGIDPAKLKTGQLSSLAVTLDRHHLGVDAWISPAGLRPVMEKLGLWFFLN
jgi:hypothetical protein